MSRRYITKDSKRVKICIKCKVRIAQPKRSYCAECNREACRQYAIVNRERRNARLRAWRLKNPELARQKDLRARYRKKYKLSLEQLEKLKKTNNYKCWICNKENKRLVVDHDHETGRVRGMLCDLCNKHLGYFENMEVEKIKQYLDKPCHADILLQIANE